VVLEIIEGIGIQEILFCISHLELTKPFCAFLDRDHGISLTSVQALRLPCALLKLTLSLPPESLFCLLVEPGVHFRSKRRFFICFRIEKSQMPLNGQ
jgi:hypothetical protein